MQKKLLLIFDFDETLAKEHLFRRFRNNIQKVQTEYSNDEDFRRVFFNDFYDMKAMFNSLVSDGHMLAIASFGFQEMIELFIQKSYEFKLFQRENIIGTGGVPPTGAWKNRSIMCGAEKCKNALITELMEKNGVQDPYNVIFFDDDSTNIQSARHKWPNMNCVHVTAGNLRVKTILDALADREQRPAREQASRKEAQRKAEEAQREAEEAQRKAEEAQRKEQEEQQRLEEREKSSSDAQWKEFMLNIETQLGKKVFSRYKADLERLKEQFPFANPSEALSTDYVADVISRKEEDPENDLVYELSQ
jgi:predicted phosphatase